MFVASRSHARAVSVLLGGSGTCQPVAGAEPELAALLSPQRPQTNQDVAGSMSVAWAGREYFPGRRVNAIRQGVDNSQCVVAFHV